MTFDYILAQAYLDSGIYRHVNILECIIIKITLLVSAFHVILPNNKKSQLSLETLILRSVDSNALLRFVLKLAINW